jgi:hypothetical protein
VHATLSTPLFCRDRALFPLSGREGPLLSGEQAPCAAVRSPSGSAERLTAFVLVRAHADSDLIAVGPTARGSQAVVRGKPAFGPLFRWLSCSRAYCRPADPVSASSTAREEAAFRLSLLRATYPRLPRRIRYLPAYVEARRRLAGQGGPDRIGRFLERLALKGLEAPR